MEADVVTNLIMMLNKHHQELRDALQERHDQLIKSLLYDMVSISKRSDANNNLTCREDQTGPGSPSEIIRAASLQQSGGESSEDVNAKPKTKIVKTYSKERNFAEICPIGARRILRLQRRQRSRKPSLKRRRRPTVGLRAGCPTRPKLNPAGLLADLCQRPEYLFLASELKFKNPGRASRWETMHDSGIENSQQGRAGLQTRDISLNELLIVLSCLDGTDGRDSVGRGHGVRLKDKS